MLHVLTLLMFGMLALMAAPSPAYAYIDPSSGTFLLQVLAALALSGAFYFRKAVWSLRRLFTGKKNAQRDYPKAPDPAGDQEEGKG